MEVSIFFHERNERYQMQRKFMGIPSTFGRHCRFEVHINLIPGHFADITHPLMLIYNSSLEDGIFPDLRKLAKVTPIY